MARCGDGLVREDLSEGDPGFEACDDGNEDDADTCLNNCQTARCGDGVIGPNEGCDDANDDPTDGCNIVFQRVAAMASFKRVKFVMMVTLKTPIHASAPVRRRAAETVFRGSI